MNCPFSTIFWWHLAFCSPQKRGFSASYCLVFPSLVAQLLRKPKWPTGFGFLFFCGGARLLLGIGGCSRRVLATLFIPQIRGRLLTALTWAYLQESSQSGVCDLPVGQITKDCGHRRSLYHICHGASFHMLE